MDNNVSVIKLIAFVFISVFATVLITYALYTGNIAFPNEESDEVGSYEEYVTEDLSEYS